MPDMSKRDMRSPAPLGADIAAPSTFKYFVPIYLLTCAFIAAFLFFFQDSEISSCYSNIETNELQKTHIQHSAISNTFQMIISDIQFLAAHKSTRDTVTCEGGTGFESSRADVQELFLSFSKARHIYDQIRLLDSDGMEMVRVNYNNNAPFIVAEKQLQNKEDRYYFSKALKLEKGKFYLSPLDLNVENNALEMPFKPVLRIATPIFDNRDKPCGILVANYLASHLLQSIAELGEHIQSESMLLNAAGYWLISRDTERNWGFMIPSRAHMTFKSTYPEEWASITESNNGQLKTHNGIFTYAKVSPEMEMHNAALALSAGRIIPRLHSMHMDIQGKDSDHWVLVSHVPPEYANRCERKYSPANQFITAGLFIAAGFGCWFVASTITKRIRMQRKLHQMAQFDILTGLPNRAFFHDRLDMAILKAERERRKCGLLYIDLDGFKSINDNFGHQEGDRVLVRVAAILAASTRKSDTVARLGGDEFAAIVHDVTSVEDATKVGDKMIQRICDDKDLVFGSYRVGASIGVAMYPDDATAPDELTRLADAAMYNAKQSGKNKCVAQPT